MHLANTLFHLSHWPVCRAYARRLGDRPADRTLSALCALQFRRVHGFWPNYSDPRHFSEKLWCRMLYQRDPLLTSFCDKFLVRDFVASRVGPEYAVPLLWTGADPARIPFDRLPSSFVLKANHGCEFNIIVPDSATLDTSAAIRRLRRWLGINFCDDTYLGIAWGYKHVTPRILVEHYLQGESGPPVDFKLWCFSGRVVFVSTHHGRFGDHRILSYDRGFAPFNISFGDEYQASAVCERPPNLDEMTAVAEALAEGLGFIRVDLYSVGNRVYVGELTPYPGGVAAAFLPRSTDLELGQAWVKP